MIKNVLLDLDDTVFDFARSEAEALSATLTELGIAPSAETVALYSRINRGQWEMLERGETTRERLLLRRYELLFQELRVNIEPSRAQSLYESHLSQAYYYLPGAEEMLDGLVGKYRLYIASNGTARVQDGRIAISGISKYFDGIFISERIGYNKPSREFFDACFLKIPNFKKEETIIIGDSLTSDILGGINAGIKSCHFNPKRLPPRADIIPDYTVGCHAEIPPLLERI